MVTVLTLLFPALSVFGLTIVLIGSIITARAVIMRDEKAIKVGGQAGLSGYSKPGGPRLPTHEQSIQQPAVKNLIRQSRHARFGLYLIAAGTFFQILGAVPSFFPHH
jgi:hypothetical protein